MPKQRATTNAKALFKRLIAHVLSDSIQIKAETLTIGSSKNCVTLHRFGRPEYFHLVDNLSAQRFNRTVLRMVVTVCAKKKSNCKYYISSVVQSYDDTKSSFTGYSLHVLMFGWHPRLPVDAYLDNLWKHLTISKMPQICIQN